MTEPQHTTNVSPPPTFLSYRQLEEAHQRIEANGRQDLGEKKLNPRTCINLTTQGYSVDISREAQPGEFNKSRGENKFKHGYPWVFFPENMIPLTIKNLVGSFISHWMIQTRQI